MSLMSKQNLVLLGGGFAGTWIATHATPAHTAKFEVTLVSEEPAFTFSPLLINGLAGDLAATDYTLDLTKLASERGFRFIQAKVDLIDRETKTIHLTQANGNALTLPYDTAVLATGAKTNFFDIPGLEQEALTLKHLSDVEHIVARLRETLNTASKVWTDEEKKQLLSFVIVGGGPTGIELLGAMQERLTYLAYEAGLEALLPFVSITLIESNKLLFYGFPEELGKKSEQILKQNGVRVCCDVKVTSAEKGKLTFADQTTLSYGTLIWAAGVKATTPPIQPAFPPGPLTSNEFLQLDDSLFGVGDAVLYEQNGVRFNKTAQFALQMGHDVLQNILRQRKGQPLIHPKSAHTAALVTVLQTGFFRYGSFVLKGRWVHAFRKLIYRFRLWQIRTGR